MTISHTLDCMSLSSYGVGHYATSGNVRVNLDLLTNIEGMNVLLVEDIVDSGRTLAHVLQMLRTREPKSLKVCVLLDKKYRREVPVEVDYVGFDVPDKYVLAMASTSTSIIATCVSLHRLIKNLRRPIKLRRR